MSRTTFPWKRKPRAESLNLAVKRNADRFPEDFTFQLTDDEAAGLRFHFETSKGGRGGRRYLPYALTEHSALQVANILNSANAVRMSMTIGEEWRGEVNSS